MKNVLGLLFVVLFIGSVTSASAQGQRGPNIPDRAAGVRGVERSLGKQREMRDYNDRIRDKQRREGPSMGGPKRGPISRDILDELRKPLS